MSRHIPTTGAFALSDDQLAAGMASMTAALDGWIDTVAGRFPFRAAVFRRLARREWWRAAIIAAVIRRA